MGIKESKSKLAIKVRVMPAHYASSMTEFFGADVSRSAPVLSYGAKIKPGVEDKWERKFKEAFGL